MPDTDAQMDNSRWTMRDFYAVLFRHKWKIVLFFATILAAAALGTILSEEVYRSEAKLLVKIGRENATLDPTAATGPMISVGQNREHEINSELEILRSWDLMQRVVNKLGPQSVLYGAAPPGPSTPPPMTVRRRMQSVWWQLQSRLDELSPWDTSGRMSPEEKAAVHLTQHLKIEVQKNSNILSIAYHDKTPYSARAVLSEIVSGYLDKHITTHRTAGSHEFFRKQTDALHHDLQESENALRALKNETGLASLEEQRKVLLLRMGDLYKEREVTAAALGISAARVTELRKEIADLARTHVLQETAGLPNSAADGMRQRLYELQIKEQDLLSRYKEDSIPVVEIRRQITAAQQVLEQEEPKRVQVTRGINTVHQQLDLALLNETVNLSSLQAKARIVQEQIGAAQAELRGINNAEVRIHNLQRELTLKDAKYRKYSENLEQARIDQALENNKISNISVVQPATYSVQSVWPRKALNLMLGFFFGLLGGIGLALVSEHFDHSIRSPADVQKRLQVPTLAALPLLKKGL